MLEEPGYWQGHYHGSMGEQRLARHVGLADRIRYYWPHPQAQAAAGALMADLSARNLPEPLLWQAFPESVLTLAEVIPGPRPQALLQAAVQEMLMPYFFDEDAGA